MAMASYTLVLVYQLLAVLLSTENFKIRANSARILKRGFDRRAVKSGSSTKVIAPTVTIAGEMVLYAIGDTHGDKNYLVRCLLATERFRLDEQNLVQWKDIDEDDNFEVVILGDFIDRGLFSRECVMLLKRLYESQPKKGGSLVVLMGNHESMMLRFETKHAQKQGWSNGWTKDKREANLTDSDGEGFELISWLRTRPVVHLTNGALMMHGGLSEPIASKVVETLNDLGVYKARACAQYGEACGKAAVEFINAKASEFYQKLHDCYVDDENEKNGKACADGVVTPFVLAGSRKFVPNWSGERKGGGGVLWYRGYSHLQYGGGTPDACDDAKKIGEMFGFQMMMVAHSTHATITEYCGDSFPVFAVDTHYKDCWRTKECDFGVGSGHTFHENDINFTAKNVPQALVITRDDEDGSIESKKCYSQVKGDGTHPPEANVECTDVDLTCHCLDGFTTTITDRECICTPAPCDIIGATGSGPDCKCFPGLSGKVKWNNDQPSGKCYADAEDLFTEGEDHLWNYKGKSIKCCVSPKKTKLQDMNAELPSKGKKDADKPTDCDYMFGSSYYNGMDGVQDDEDLEDREPSCHVRVTKLMDAIDADFDEVKKLLDL